MADERLDLRARARADLADHRAALADQDPLLRLGLDEHARADGCRRARRPRPSARAAPRRASDGAPSRGSPRRRAPRASGRFAARAGSSDGPSGSRCTRSSRSSSIPSRTFALTGWSAWKSPSRGRDLHLRRDVPVLEAVDLVQRDHDGHAEREDASRDEAVAGADPVACRQHEEHDVDVLERPVDRLLHPLGERVHRAAGSPGRSTSTSCQSSPFATPKIRRRVVFGTVDVIATFSPVRAFTSVDLPTFGRPATATRPAFIEPPRASQRGRRRDLEPVSRRRSYSGASASPSGRRRGAPASSWTTTEPRGRSVQGDPRDVGEPAVGAAELE